MKNNWELIVFEKENKAVPLDEFLDSLPKKQRAKVLRALLLLEEHGLSLPFPHRSHIEGDLHELRTRLGKNQFRILFFHFGGRELILLSGFTKKGNKLPTRELNKARSFRVEYIARRREVEE